MLNIPWTIRKKKMKIKNFLNGGTTVKTNDKTYQIINLNSLKKSEDGYFRYIYYIYDHKTKKYYIGQHRTFSIEMDDYAGSGSKILNEYENAKKELGDEWESRFTKCIIANALSEEELEYLEKKIISKEVLSDTMSYNMVVGGKTGYKASNSINVYVYDKNGTLLEKFTSINQSANWAIENANTRGKLSNCVSAIAKSIKNEKYKTFGLYFVDYEIDDWSRFLESLKDRKSKTKVPKNSPVVLIDERDKSRNIFKNRQAAAEWIISNDFSSTDSIKQVMHTINNAIQEERCAYGFIVKYLNMHCEKSVKLGTALLKSNARISSLIHLIDKYNSVFDFGKEKFIVEIDETTFETALSAVSLFNMQHNSATDVNPDRSEFSFMGVHFRKTCGNPRIVIEDCLKFGSKKGIPPETEEELVALCSSLSFLDGVTVLSSSSGHFGDDRVSPGTFNVLFKCSNMKSLKFLMDSVFSYDRRHAADSVPSRTRFEAVNERSVAGLTDDSDVQMNEILYRMTNISLNSKTRIERIKAYSEISDMLERRK